MSKRLKDLTSATKLKKEIEVEEIIIYPIYRKITDAMTGKIITIFKVDLYTITKVVCGDDLYPSIQVFENNKYTLSSVYWYGKATTREYLKYLRQVKESIG